MTSMRVLELADGCKVQTFARRPSPSAAPARHVVLLHGMRFSAATWDEAKLGTPEALARHGIGSTTVNLPGYGSSSASTTLKPAEFLSQALDQILEPGEKAVVVSPSMSGKYAVPLVVSHAADAKLAGWVPVAPVGVRDGMGDSFAAVSLPALIVYGSEDPMGVSSAPILGRMPLSTALVIEGGSHPAYLDAPETFNEALIAFVSRL